MTTQRRSRAAEQRRPRDHHSRGRHDRDRGREHMVTIADVRRVALSLPRTEEHLIRGRIKFRVGRIVYIAFSRDGETMGFAFPKELRAGLVEAEPDKFCMPEPSDLRYNWACVRLAAIDKAEMYTLVIEAWRIVVPRRVAAAHLEGSGRSVGLITKGTKSVSARGRVPRRPG